MSLTGRRVLVMRAAQQAAKLSERLRELGAETVVVPVLEIRPPVSPELLDKAVGRLSSFDWLILTSANTVDAVASRCTAIDLDVSGIKLLKVAAVGSATAEAARKAGFRVTLVPDSYSSEGVVAAMGTAVAGKKVLLARAKVARDVIPDALTAAGAEMTVVDAYETGLPEGAREQLAEALRAGVDAAAFTSSSTVRNLAEVAREAGVAFPLAGVKAVSIGPVTSATLREYGWEPAAEAAMADVQSLIEALQGLGPKD